MIDGRLRSPSEQVVSVFDRGFLYGDSVFETLRTYGGRLFAPDEHFARLEESARRVFIPMPVGRAQLHAEVSEALGAAASSESYVRVMVTRGEGALGLDPASATRPLRVVLVTPLHTPAPESYVTGAAAVTYRTQRVIDGSGAEGAKIGNYLSSVLAMRVAAQAKAVEALLIDAAGRVVEGASSNVFVVQRGTLVTAPLEAGILAGITRGVVLALAAELRIPLELRSPSLEEVFAADELFVTSSIREVMPIVRLDGRAIGTGAPGPFFRRLSEAFGRRVRQMTSAPSPLHG